MCVCVCVRVHVCVCVCGIPVHMGIGIVNLRAISFYCFYYCPILFMNIVILLCIVFQSTEKILLIQNSLKVEI